MHRKLRYISKLVQLVVQVHYHMNVIYKFVGEHTHMHAHTHTDVTDTSNFKKPGMRGLKIINYLANNNSCYIKNKPQFYYKIYFWQTARSQSRD